jgi:hypothetical protein
MLLGHGAQGLREGIHLVGSSLVGPADDLHDRFDVGEDGRAILEAPCVFIRRSHRQAEETGATADSMAQSGRDQIIESSEPTTAARGA